MNRIPMTVLGEQALRDELENLTRVERKRIIAAIAEARGHGDLKENAEYHEAKREQSLIEGRIQEIEHKLSLSQVIDVKNLKNTGKVIFGATVTLVDARNDKEVTYQIVGEDEADIKSQKISIASPIARALIGKVVDNVVEVHTPQGVMEYEVLSVDLI